MRSTTKLMYDMFQYDPVLFCFGVVENKRFLIPDIIIVVLHFYDIEHEEWSARNYSHHMMVCMLKC